MRKIIYDTLGDFGEDLITGLQVIFNFLIDILTGVGNTIIASVANIFKMSMWLIDKERVDHTETVIEQFPLNNELQILMNVTRLKEDALERKTWTNHHSSTLNQLSSKLYNECNWDQNRIHEYMRAIVESIPGLSYVPGDDEEDDDSMDLED